MCPCRKGILVLSCIRPGNSKYIRNATQWVLVRRQTESSNVLWLLTRVHWDILLAKVYFRLHWNALWWYRRNFVIGIIYQWSFIVVTLIKERNKINKYVYTWQYKIIIFDTCLERVSLLKTKIFFIYKVGFPLFSNQICMGFLMSKNQ